MRDKIFSGFGLLTCKRYGSGYGKYIKNLRELPSEGQLYGQKVVVIQYVNVDRWSSLLPVGLVGWIAPASASGWQEVGNDEKTLVTFPVRGRHVLKKTLLRVDNG